VFTSRFQHPLAAVPLIGAQFNTPNVPIHGSGQSPNVGSAVSLRHIAVPGDWDKTSIVIPLGNSGDPKSPHWKDMFEIWSTGKTNPAPFSNEAITKAAVSTVRWIP
jgi:penicillin amidase